VPEKKTGIDVRTADLDRGLNPASSLGSFHRNRPQNSAPSLSKITHPAIYNQFAADRKGRLIGGARDDVSLDEVEPMVILRVKFPKRADWKSEKLMRR
jgi:hypothetical protein